MFSEIAMVQYCQGLTYINIEDGEFIKHDRKDLCSDKTDNNGLLIYENDIVEYIYKERFLDSIKIKNIVTFHNGEFYPKEDNYDCDDSFYSWIRKDFKVIRNTYNNPKLVN